MTEIDKMIEESNARPDFIEWVQDLVNSIRFRFTTQRWSLQHDRDYGIDHRTGWSLVHDGHFLVQLSSLYYVIGAWIKELRGI